MCTPGMIQQIRIRILGPPEFIQKAMRLTLLPIGPRSLIQMDGIKLKLRLRGIVD